MPDLGARTVTALFIPDDDPGVVEVTMRIPTTWLRGGWSLQGINSQQGLLALAEAVMNAAEREAAYRASLHRPGCRCADHDREFHHRK